MAGKKPVQVLGGTPKPAVVKRVKKVVPESTIAIKPVVTKVPPKKIAAKPKASAPKTKRPKIPFHSERLTDSELIQRQELAERLVEKIFSESRATSDEDEATKPVITNPKSTTSASETLSLPSNWSERVLSKGRALQQWYHVDLPQKAARVATYAGGTFVLIGSLSILQLSLTSFPGWVPVQTALLCSTLPCEPSSTPLTSVADLEEPPTAASEPAPEVIPPAAVTFLTSVSAQVASDTVLIVRAEYVRELTVVAEAKKSGLLRELRRSGEPAGNDVSFVLPATLPPDSYTVRVRAVAARDGKRILLTGPSFTIPVAKAPQTEETTEETTDEITSETKEVNEPELASTTPERAASSTRTSITQTPAVLDVPSLSYTTTELQDVVRLSVDAGDALAVELYAQRLSATTPLFIGLARRLDTTTFSYTYNTQLLPVGEYIFFGRVKRSTGLVRTNETRFEVHKPTVVKTSASGTTPLPSVTETAKVVTELADAPDTPIRSQYAESVPKKLPTVPARSTTSTPTPVVEPAPIKERHIDIAPVFTERSDRLNELLRRYAAAFQVGDTATVGLINEEIKKERESMITTMVTGGEASVTASDARILIENEFTTLIGQVETFEQLLKERSGGSSANDSDADGVADYDEVTLYNTDPNAFDSDSDGVSDGAEIMRGFDPLDGNSEAILDYATPKEFGIVREDILTVETIIPVVETDDSRGTARVQSEIRGRGLPNSYVTLFIYSSPIVVIVKTDADGNFVYQLDKELTDGSHEIYAAITDNTGAILAKSQPFGFIKEAEAFTAIPSSGTEVVSSVTPETPVNSAELYRVIPALAVLALGLVLLIFGLTMRRREELPIIRADDPVVTA